MNEKIKYNFLAVWELWNLQFVKQINIIITFYFGWVFNDNIYFLKSSKIRDQIQTES